jgi:hypothetical protein
MAKRHSNALAILGGACNPSGIALAIVEACTEARAEPGFTGTAALTGDPAIRLMIHQLSFICKVGIIDNDLDEYRAAIDACVEKP